MRTSTLAPLALAIGLSFAACTSLDTPVDGTGGAPESAGTGGATTNPGSGGASVTRGTGGANVNPGTGGANVNPGTGGALAAPGTGGAVVGTGGAITIPGTGGVITLPGTGGMGTGGAVVGAGGASPGTGGAVTTGTGGLVAGTGGDDAGTDDASPDAGTDGLDDAGTGGAVAGTGGSPSPVGPSSLPTPPGASGLPPPSGAQGGLSVVSWAGFKAAVSYTFDDANSSQITNYPALQAMGVPLSFFLITSKPEASNAIWGQALADGHEIGNHTNTHPQTGSLADIDAATTFLKTKWGVTAYDMVAPYGDASYPPLAKMRFFMNRGVSNGLMGPNDGTDPFNLFCYIAPQSSLASAYNAQIDQARTAGKWRVVLVHGFTGGTDGAYQPVSIGEFTSSVTHTKSLGDVWIDTMLNVGAYWVAQKTVSAVAPTQTGSDKTWTWTLPAHFVPGKYLRVTLTGGTPTQNGHPVPWNDHGYYEIALDAGSLTVSP